MAEARALKFFLQGRLY